VVVDPEQAARLPELAVLSAMAHGTHPDRGEIWHALLTALATVDPHGHRDELARGLGDEIRFVSCAKQESAFLDYDFLIASHRSDVRPSFQRVARSRGRTKPFAAEVRPRAERRQCEEARVDRCRVVILIVRRGHDCGAVFVVERSSEWTRRVDTAGAETRIELRVVGPHCANGRIRLLRWPVEDETWSQIQSAAKDLGVAVLTEDEWLKLISLTQIEASSR